MKKKKITILLALALAMTGCTLRSVQTGGPESPAVSEVPEETKETPAAPELPEGNDPATALPEAAPEPEVDYAAYYQPVIDELFRVASGEYDAENLPAGGMSLLEGNSGGADNAMLWNAGYRIGDLSGDGIPELLVGEADGKRIYALYTVKDGQVHLTLEGYYRNSYARMEDGTFLNQGSAGAIYSVFGLYDLSADGRTLICRDFWFTHEKDGNYEDIRCWHNTTGAMDPGVSEELAMTLDGFWEKEAELMDRLTALDLIPFGEYGGLEKPVYAEDPTVQAVYGSDYTGEYDSCTADDWEYAVDVVFLTDGAVRDFKIISLTMTDISEDGEVSFAFEELYSYGELTPEKGLAVKMSMPETIPFYGISYTDGTGNTRVFSVNLSGFDGSVYLSEIGGVG